MNKSAILHIPMSQYAFAEDEKVFTIRLRAAKGDLDSCTLYYGDRACIQSPVVFQEIPMELHWQDTYFDYFEKTMVYSSLFYHKDIVSFFPKNNSTFDNFMLYITQYNLTYSKCELKNKKTK